MGSTKADSVAVSQLETRIDPGARVAPLKSLAALDWDDREVVPLRQDGPWDPRELLFAGLTCYAMDPRAPALVAITARIVVSPSKSDKYLA